MGFGLGAELRVRHLRGALGEGEDGRVDRIVQLGARVARTAVVDGGADGGAHRHQRQGKGEGNVSVPVPDEGTSAGRGGTK